MLTAGHAHPGPFLVRPGRALHVDLVEEGPQRARDGSLDMAELSQRYGIEFDMESLPAICAEHGLTHPLLATA